MNLESVRNIPVPIQEHSGPIPVPLYVRTTRDARYVRVIGSDLGSKSYLSMQQQRRATPARARLDSATKLPATAVAAAAAVKKKGTR